MIKIKKKGWIIFMTFSSWATLLAGCKKWPGDQSPVEITTEAPVAITDIQEISFQESGSMIPLVSYTTMTRENEGIRVQLELQYQYEYEKMMDASLMDQVQKSLKPMMWENGMNSGEMTVWFWMAAVFHFTLRLRTEHPFLHLEIMHFQRIRERSFPS